MRTRRDFNKVKELDFMEIDSEVFYKNDYVLVKSEGAHYRKASKKAKGKARDEDDFSVV